VSGHWREALALAGFAVACALVVVAGFAVPLLARKIALRGTDGEGDG
jgi:hypothetical protein